MALRIPLAADGNQQQGNGLVSTVAVGVCHGILLLGGRRRQGWNRRGYDTIFADQPAKSRTLVEIHAGNLETNALGARVS